MGGGMHERGEHHRAGFAQNSTINQFGRGYYDTFGYSPYFLTAGFYDPEKIEQNFGCGHPTKAKGSLDFAARPFDRRGRGHYGGGGLRARDAARPGGRALAFGFRNHHRAA